MKKITILFACCLLAASTFCQKETIDLITFNIPKGWKKEANDGVISYVITNKKTGSWCRISVYKSVPSKGSVEADLEKEWSELAAKPLKIADTVRSTPVEEADGWKVKVASAQFSYNDKPATALLTTYSGYDRCASILALSSDKQYAEAIQNFIAAIDIKKPDEKIVSKDNPTTVNTGSYTFSTTNFDDGWVSIVKEDWIEVTKGDMTVFLLYGLPYNASDFSGTGVRARDYYWDNYVTKYFSVETKQYNDNGEFIASFQPDYVEGWAKDKATGQKRFIAMRLSIAPNTAYVVIASAKNEPLLRQQFPKANDKYSSDLANMSGYNKFAVAENDLIGTWSSSGGGTMNWYSITTGNNVGATGAVTGDIFRFNADGSYSSDHSGATGWVGAMNTFQQKYKGSYTVSNWIVTATKRFDGKTENFNAWFEVFKGGRVLHLDSPGLKFSLIKEK